MDDVAGKFSQAEGEFAAEVKKRADKDEDGAFGFEDQGKDFAGAHEGGEFGEEGALFVDGIEAGGFARSEDHRFDGHNAEASLVDARENLTLKIARYGVRFDDGESAFE